MTPCFGDAGVVVFIALDESPSPLTPLAASGTADDGASGRGLDTLVGGMALEADVDCGLVDSVGERVL